MRDQFISDILYAQRVVDRIEQLDGLNETQTLSIVFIGTQPYNAKMYWKNYNYSQSIEELRRSSMAPWMPDQILRYVAPNLQLRNTPLDTIEDTELREKIRIMQKSILGRTKKVSHGLVILSYVSSITGACSKSLVLCGKIL